MTDTEKEIYKAIKDQNRRSGVVQVNDDIISLITGFSTRTIQRTLKTLQDKGIIERHTRYTKSKTYSNGVVAIRYIFPRSNDVKYKGFSIEEQINLSKKYNHKAVEYTNGIGKPSTYEYWRRPGGFGTEWELNMPDKDFKSFKHVWEFITSSIIQHFYISETGDYGGKFSTMYKYYNKHYESRFN